MATLFKGSVPPRRNEPKLTSNRKSKSRVDVYLDATLHWYRFGLDVIPIVPGTKKTAVKWDTWLSNLSELAVRKYWQLHPEHEIGFIIGSDLIVFDADTPQSLSRLCDIEKAFDASPALTVKTIKGQHHYYKLAEGTRAKSDSHSSEKHPERIDVRTGRALIVLPPSGGRELLIDEVANISELTIVNQGLVDAINVNNGREPYRKHSPAKTMRPLLAVSSLRQKELAALLEPLDPDCGYNDWLRICMALHHATEGSDDGLYAFDEWSARGGKYPGFREIEYKWSTIKENCETPVTIATVLWMLREHDHDPVNLCGHDDFEICECVVIDDYDPEVSND